MTGRLADKVAVITATAGGQGREAALRFAAEGERVVGCDLNAEGAGETVAMVRAHQSREDFEFHHDERGDDRLARGQSRRGSV